MAEDESFEDAGGGVGFAGVDGVEDGALGGRAVEGCCPGCDVLVGVVDVPGGVPASCGVDVYVCSVCAAWLDAGCGVEGYAVEGFTAADPGAGLIASGAGEFVDRGEEAGGPWLGGGANFGFCEVEVYEVGGHV